MLRQVLLLSSLLFLNGWAYASCDVFIKEAEAFEGVVPRFNDDGSLRSILMYGEASFITPKRSLISNARRKAELKAKRAFTEFLQSDFQSDTIASDMVNSAQTTNMDGVSEGSVEEVSVTLDLMKQSSSAVLSGIVKLDECVDTDENFLLVAMGWKPQMSAVAKSATNSMKNPPPLSANSKVKAKGSSKSNAGESGKRAGSKEVAVRSFGIGRDLSEATTNGLRSAVSQVHGERFSSDVVSLDSVSTLEIGSSVGLNVSGSMESSNTTSKTASKTSGVIKSWRYISKEEESGGYQVELEVTLPVFESLDGDNKVNVIVLSPKFLKRGIKDGASLIDDFSFALKNDLESQIASSVTMSVIDNAYVQEVKSELDRIAQTGNVSEMAKLGQGAGADILIVPEFSMFKTSVEETKSGELSITRSIFNLRGSLKLIEVASSKLISGKRISVGNKKFKMNNAASQASLFVTQNAVKILNARFGGISSSSLSSNQNSRKDIKKLEKKINDKFEKVKKDAEDDW